MERLQSTLTALAKGSMSQDPALLPQLSLCGTVSDADIGARKIPSPRDVQDWSLYVHTRRFESASELYDTAKLVMAQYPGKSLDRLVPS